MFLFEVFPHSRELQITTHKTKLELGDPKKSKLKTCYSESNCIYIDMLMLRIYILYNGGKYKFGLKCDKQIVLNNTIKSLLIK